jgi:hypothetical protein
MSTPDKPDHARGWRYVEKLLDEEEDERIKNLGDDELRAELRQGSTDAEAEWSADELLARAEAEAAKTPPPAVRAGPEAPPAAGPAQEPPARKIAPVKAVAPVISIRRSRIAWLLVAVLAIAAVFALTRPEIVARFHPDHGNSNPDDDQSPRPTRHEAADLLRDEALDLCGRAAWVVCKDKLDEAARLDPGGESEPRVQKARADIQSAERPGPKAPKTPGP